MVHVSIKKHDLCLSYVQSLPKLYFIVAYMAIVDSVMNIQ